MLVVGAAVGGRGWGIAALMFLWYKREECCQFEGKVTCFVEDLNGSNRP